MRGVLGWLFVIVTLFFFYFSLLSHPNFESPDGGPPAHRSVTGVLTLGLGTA